MYLAAWAVTTWTASRAGAAQRDEGEHWDLYEGWMRSCWQGRVGGVIEERTCWQEKLGRPPPGEELGENDPVKLLAQTLT